VLAGTHRRHLQQQQQQQQQHLSQPEMRELLSFQTFFKNSVCKTLNTLAKQLSVN